MSKFLTPPVWYNSDGSLDQSLTGVAYEPGTIYNTAYGQLAKAGSSNHGVDGCIAIGYNALASQDDAIAIGSYEADNGATNATAEGAIAIGNGASSKSTNAIAIGRGASVEASQSIAIGNGAEAYNQNTIQLGNNNTAYTLNIGNGSGTINGVYLSDAFEDNKITVKMATSAKKLLNGTEFAIVDGAVTITSAGLYLCNITGTATNYLTGLITVYNLNQDTFGIYANYDSSRTLHYSSTSKKISIVFTGSGTDPLNVKIARCIKIMDIA